MNFPDYIGSGQGVILSSWCGNAVDYTEAISEQKLQRVQFVLFLFLLFFSTRCVTIHCDYSVYMHSSDSEDK